MQQDGKKPVIFAEKIVGFFFFFFLPNVAKWIVFVLCTATYIKMSLRVKKKNRYQETNMYSQMMELVLCFMGKMTGKKFLVSPQSDDLVLLRAWNTCVVWNENNHQETWGITKQCFPSGASAVPCLFVKVEGLCCSSCRGSPEQSVESYSTVRNVRGVKYFMLRIWNIWGPNLLI